MNLWTILTFLLLYFNCCKSDFLPVHSKYEWVNIDYKYPTPEARQDAISSRKFIPGNARVIDVDVHYDERENRKIFITTPSFARGIPATLSVITDNTQKSPSLAPYPSWDWYNDLETCPTNRLLSVFRIKIDECGRLWVLDTGLITFVPTCPPQILAFDLKTNALIHRYEIPAEVLQSNSLLTLPMVDVRDTETCSGTFIYVADSRAFGIIVFDVDNNASWKVTDKTMHATPDFGTVCVAGSQFELMDGVQGMALSPYEKGKDRVLFYHAFSSNTEQWIWTSKLRNRTAGSNPDYFHLYCDRRDTQCSPMAIDKKGRAYFGLAGDTSLNCWNTFTPYNNRNINPLYKDRNTLQYINGLKIVTKINGNEEIWLSNTRVERIVTGPTNSSTINYRVQTASLNGFDGCQKKWYSGRCKEYFDSCRFCYNCIIEDQ